MKKLLNPKKLLIYLFSLILLGFVLFLFHKNIEYYFDEPSLPNETFAAGRSFFLAEGEILVLEDSTDLKHYVEYIDEVKNYSVTLRISTYSEIENSLVKEQLVTFHAYGIFVNISKKKSRFYNFNSHLVEQYPFFTIKWDPFGGDLQFSENFKISSEKKNMERVVPKLTP